MSDCKELLRRALIRMRAINGPNQRCICRAPDDCLNHGLIMEIELYFERIGVSING